MTNLVLDIESKADPAFFAEHGDWCFSRIEPDARLKDEAKIAADLEAKKGELVERAPLNPFAGRVIAIGVGDLDSDDDPTVFACEDEYLLLRSWSERMRALTPITWCGFNVRKFDLPFLAYRCAKLEVPWPGHYPARNDYRRCVDVLDLTFDVSPPRGGSCDWHLRGMGLPPKTESGANVKSMSLDEIKTYCAADVARERLLLRKLRNYFPALHGETE